MAGKLTPKQQRFVELFDGNGADAARKAGYGGNDQALATAANRLLRNVHIAQAIKARETKRIKPDIANREQRQAFWTDMMKDAAAPEVARLKASELLGKSEGDFIQRHELTGKDGKPIEMRDVSSLTDEQRLARINELISKRKGGK